MTAAREKALDAACKIDGWLTRREAGLLYDLAHNAHGPIVEIGSWQGRSTAALALGSAAGRKSLVYAIDPFIGPQEGARTTSLGTRPDVADCSPLKLRMNLDAAGVNGAVTIIPLPSHEALADTPRTCSLLFVDGAHDYEAVCRDLDNYLPRVMVGGFVVLHDFNEATDPGVVQAVEDRVLSRPNQWRRLDHLDSALVLRRVETQRRTINLLCPGRGYDWGPVTGIVQATLGAHLVRLDNNGNGWDDFNHLWARALNLAQAGRCTHVAMLHSDITPQAGWLDILMDEMEELDVDLISVACPMKDRRGVLNCGVGNTGNRWGAWRRLTMRELWKLPPTFDLADLAGRGFCGEDASDKVLLHNTGCFVADLRRDVFRQIDAEGNNCAWFDFPTRIRWDAAAEMWVAMRESEDWFFSRQLHMLGANTRITRKVQLVHEGRGEYPSSEPWGEYENGDEDTRPLWDPGYVKKEKQ